MGALVKEVLKENLRISILAVDKTTEEHWVKVLAQALNEEFQATIHPFQEAFLNKFEPGQVIFVDSALPRLNEALSELDRRGRAIFLLVPEGSDVPEVLKQGRVDDILIHPFRTLEVVSKLRQYQQILMWEEVAKLNASFSDLLGHLHEDLKVAERLQKSKLPVRFPDIKGFRITSRYLAGMRSGGDYFDLAEPQDRSQLSLVLSDSSSYGLSGAVLSILMRVAMKLSAGEVRSSHETVQRICDELLVTLSEKDQLSLFYGVISRKNFKLRYTQFGSSCLFHSPASQEFRILPSQGGLLSLRGGKLPSSEVEVQLSPADRLVLVSDGFLDAVGGAVEAAKLLDRFRGGDASDSLNELVFRVKSKLTDSDAMPGQDCTAVILDMDQRLIRLT